MKLKVARRYCSIASSKPMRNRATSRRPAQRSDVNGLARRMIYRIILKDATQQVINRTVPIPIQINENNTYHLLYTQKNPYLVNITCDRNNIKHSIKFFCTDLEALQISYDIKFSTETSYLRFNEQMVQSYDSRDETINKAIPVDLLRTMFQDGDERNSINVNVFIKTNRIEMSCENHTESLNANDLECPVCRQVMLWQIYLNTSGHSTSNKQKDTPQLVHIAATKSNFEVKTDDKLFKIQKINTSANSVVNSLKNDEMENSYIPSLETIFDINEEDADLNPALIEDELLGGMIAIKSQLAKVKIIIKNVMRPNFKNLLFDNEKKMLTLFYSLKNVYQFVCCKLFTHKIKWYNTDSFIDNLRNCALRPHLGDLNDMLQILEENGFVSTDYKSEELSYLLTLLKMDEVKKICKDLRIKGNLQNKQQHIDAILSRITTQSTLNPLKPIDNFVKDMVYKQLGAMFKIKESFYNMFYKLHLIYSFTNPELEIPHGIYKLLREINYNNNIIPKYNVSDSVIFETPEEFAAFSKAFSYKEELVQETEKKNSDKMVTLKLCEEIFEELKIILNQKNIKKHTKPGFLNRFTPGWQYASALCLGINKLSATYPFKAKLWLQELLKQDHFQIRKPSLLYVQLATIYKKHYKDNKSACETLVRGLKNTNFSLSDICELIYQSNKYMKKVDNSQYFGEVSHLFVKAPDVRNFPTITINVLCNSEESLYKHINEKGDTEYLRVEDFAIRHYVKTQGFHESIHCEGALMNTLFHIFLWDIIYKDTIPGVFINSIQRQPLDLHHADFYKSRKRDIEERIKNVKSVWSVQQFDSHFRKTWAEASSCKAVIFLLDLECLIHIVSLLGRSFVANVCRKFAKQYDECHAGLPGLFLWNNTKCKFVEVKGPDDQLSTKQKLWIQYLLENGVDVEVCHVQSLGGRR